MADQRRRLHQRMAWTSRYLLDWGRCGEDVTPIRAYTTVIRWFNRPVARFDQLNFIESWLGEGHRWIRGDHLDNLSALAAMPIRIGPEWPVAPFGYFLAMLSDGRLDTGGRLFHEFPPYLVERRPGFVYLVDRWLRVFPSTPCPWAVWMFPPPSSSPGGV